jgi:hypothetical protein
MLTTYEFCDIRRDSSQSPKKRILVLMDQGITLESQPYSDELDFFSLPPIKAKYPFQQTKDFNVDSKNADGRNQASRGNGTNYHISFKL